LVSSREVSILSKREASSEYISTDDSYFNKFKREMNKVTIAFNPEIIPVFHGLHSTNGEIMVIMALRRIAGKTREYNLCWVRILDCAYRFFCPLTKVVKISSTFEQSIFCCVCL
jgi:hypothetical protein